MSASVQRSTRLLIALMALLAVDTAAAWGRVGHEAVAWIAIARLDAETLAHATSLLDTDAAGMAEAATWADRVRDGDDDWAHTFSWHFTNLDIREPDLEAACFGHPPVPDGMAASQAPEQSCVVDKIAQFRAELADPATPVAERRLALMFLLHFVGDLHQPLHSANDDDRGGNDKTVRLPGHEAASLHHYWDTVFLPPIEGGSRALADALLAGAEAPALPAGTAGGARDWARETFSLAVRWSYGALPEPGPDGVHVLDARYRQAAESVVAVQLLRAGYRLAAVIEEAFAQAGRDAQ